MPVYKNEQAKENKWYYSFSYKEGGKYKKKVRRGFKTKGEATAAMEEAKNAINKGKSIEPNKTPYKDFLETWLESKQTTVQKRTMEMYTYLVRDYIAPHLGEIEISKITPRDIQTLYNTLQSNGNLGDENRRKIHSIINGSLKVALRWEMIPQNPAELVDPPRISKKEVQIWTEEETKQFLEAAKEESRYYEAFLLPLVTGMRQGEVLGLRFCDIDEENLSLSIVQTLSHDGKDLKVGTKTQAGNRTVSIDVQTIAHLLALKHRYEEEKTYTGSGYKDSGLVIRTSVGTPLTPRNLSRAFDVVIKKAGVKKIKYHDLRHTHASMLLKQGVNPKIVSERLGHANVRITLDRYSHLMPNMQKDTADAFGANFYS